MEAFAGLLSGPYMGLVSRRFVSFVCAQLSPMLPCATVLVQRCILAIISLCHVFHGDVAHRPASVGCRPRRIGRRGSLHHAELRVSIR